MKNIIKILFIIFFLNSCEDSGEKKLENNSDFKPKNTQLEFKEVEAQNALNLKYQLLDVENMKVSFSSLKVLPEFPGGLDSLYIFIKEVV